MRSRARRLVVSLLASLIVASVVTGCREREVESGRADFLRMAGRDDVPTLDPAVGYDTSSWLFEDAVFNTLIDYDEGSELVGELAAEWRVSADGLDYEFELKPGVRFSNGRPLLAPDVKYSIERVLNPTTRSQGAEFFRGIAGAETCTAAACAVSGIRVAGNGRIGFRLARVDPLFLHKLAMQFAAVVPREEVERWGEDFSHHAVGSGPFVLAGWDPGHRLRLVRNPGYHVPGIPRVAGIDYAMGVGEDLAWFRYQAGQLDVLTDIPPAEFPVVARSARYRPFLQRVISMSTMYLGMNCEMPPFTDPRVRQAMNYAVNKEKVLRLVNGRGVAARGIVPPGMPGYQDSLAGYPYDPGRARSLFEEAGLGAGFSTTLWVRLDDDALRLAQAVQQDLLAVGVRLEIRSLAWGPFLEKVKSGREAPLFYLGWQADFPDASNFLETLLHSKGRGSNNSTLFSDPQVDEWLDRAVDTAAPAVRLDLLQAAEGRAVALAPWVFLYHPVSYALVHPRVRAFRLHALRPPRLETVEIDVAERRTPQ